MRDQLENDVASMWGRFPRVRGVLVSGDLAFGGREEEYDIALAWLKRLCDLAGCRGQGVWCVPGNHDVDRSVYQESQLLRDMHDRLRRVDSDEIDDRIAAYLQDPVAAPLFFRPIECYNAFAGKLGCIGRAHWRRPIRRSAARERRPTSDCHSFADLLLWAKIHDGHASRRRRASSPTAHAHWPCWCR